MSSNSPRFDSDDCPPTPPLYPCSSSDNKKAEEMSSNSPWYDSDDLSIPNLYPFSSSDNNKAEEMSSNNPGYDSDDCPSTPPLYPCSSSDNKKAEEMSSDSPGYDYDDGPPTPPLHPCSSFDNKKDEEMSSNSPGYDYDDGPPTPPLHPCSSFDNKKDEEMSSNNPGYDYDVVPPTPPLPPRFSSDNKTVEEMISNSPGYDYDDGPPTPPLYPCSSSDNRKAEEMSSNSPGYDYDDGPPTPPLYPCSLSDNKKDEEMSSNSSGYDYDDGPSTPPLYPCSSSGEKRGYEDEDVSCAKKRKLGPDPTLDVPRRMFGDIRRDSFCWSCHLKTMEYDCPHCARTYHLACFKKQKTQACICQSTSVHMEKPNINYARDLSNCLQLVLQAVEKEYSKKNKDNYLMKCLMGLSGFVEDDYICYRISIDLIADNITIGKYKNTNQFFMDIKWMTHNMYILFGGDDDSTITFNKFEKDVKLQLCDLEACGECYKEKHKLDATHDFFVKLCSTPHSIVWAKVKGYPFWPAKCLRIVNDCADVRFFGTHDKSFIPLSSVYKISRENPGGNPKKLLTSYDMALSELHVYISNYEQVYGSFQFYDKKTPLQSLKSSGKKRPQNKKKKQPMMSSNNDENDGAQANVGSNVIGGAGAKVGSDVIGGAGAKVGSDVIDGAQAMVGSDVIGGAGAKVGSDVIDGAQAMVGSEVIDGAGAKVGSDVIDGARAVVGSDVIDGAAAIVGSDVNDITDSPCQLSARSTIENSAYSLINDDDDEIGLPSGVNNLHDALEHLKQLLGRHLNNVDSSGSGNDGENGSLCDENNIDSSAAFPDSGNDDENRSPCDENNANNNLNAHQSLPDNDDNDIQYIGEEDMNSIQDYLSDDFDSSVAFAGLDPSNEYVMKAFMDLLFANKPVIRMYYRYFQQLILQQFIKMFLEIESEKSDPSKQLNIKAHFLRVATHLKTHKAERNQLQLKVAELKEKLETAEANNSRIKSYQDEVIERTAQSIVDSTFKMNANEKKRLMELTLKEQRLIKELKAITDENKELEQQLQQIQARKEIN